MSAAAAVLNSRRRADWCCHADVENTGTGTVRSSRHLAAWLGLTPKDHSTDGKMRLGTITRAGDEGLRSKTRAYAVCWWRAQLPL